MAAEASTQHRKREKRETFTLQIQGKGIRAKVLIPGWAIAEILRFAKEAERAFDGSNPAINRIGTADVKGLDDALDRAYQARDDWRHEAERLKEQLSGRQHFLESHERDVDRMQVEALANALNGCLEELDQLGSAYSNLRKKYGPPYVTYIPWSRPEALRVLQALRLEKVWDGEKYVLRLTDDSSPAERPES